MPKSVLFDKQKTIRKVTELFWEKGYNGTSMQDLVDVTGLNRSSIYNTYGDKFSLFTEALNYYRNAQNEMLDGIKAKAKSPKEFIHILFNGIWSELNSENNKGCFFSNCTAEMANSNDEVHGFLADNQEKMVCIFKDLIEKAQAQGEIKADKDVETLANYLFSSLHGLRITSMINPDRDKIKAVADQVLSAL